jgi:hypothetical protein
MQKLASQGVVTGVIVLLVAAGAGVSFLQAVNAIITGIMNFNFFINLF